MSAFLRVDNFYSSVNLLAYIKKVLANRNTRYKYLISMDEFTNTYLQWPKLTKPVSLTSFAS